MGHRAVVAVEREDGSYALYRSQWGATALFDGDQSFARAVDAATKPGRPTAVAEDAAAVLAALAVPGDEALFVVGDGAVTGYLVCPLGLDSPRSASSQSSSAVLVPVADADAARRLDRFRRTLRDVLGDAVDAGLLARPLAVGYLAMRVARHPDCPPGTLWKGR